jgi:hypothetical protein
MALHGSAIPDAAVVVIATENGGSLALDLAENEQHLAAGDEAESIHPAHSILSVYQPSPSQVPLISKEVALIEVGVSVLGVNLKRGLVVLGGFYELSLILEEDAVIIAVGTQLAEQRPLIRWFLL